MEKRIYVGDNLGTVSDSPYFEIQGMVDVLDETFSRREILGSAGFTYGFDGQVDYMSFLLFDPGVVLTYFSRLAVPSSQIDKSVTGVPPSHPPSRGRIDCGSSDIGWVCVVSLLGKEDSLVGVERKILPAIEAKFPTSQVSHARSRPRDLLIDRQLSVVPESEPRV